MKSEILQTSLGLIKGVKQNSYTVYKGIRYAKPPVGDRRFRAPEPIEPWEGVYHADKFGHICFQKRRDKGSFYDKEFGGDTDGNTIMDEDCLFLNIWVPDHEPNEQLPVAFWIHGGAFMTGFGNDLHFDGEAFCQKKVILVTINYRLGAFGFLAHPSLDLENENGVSGNYGILDQIEGLKWVYDNINSFGGNPKKITVFGQSAGANSVQSLISSPLTKRIICGAIIQSGGGYRSDFMKDKSLEEMENDSSEFLSLCGVDNIEDLRNQSAEFLVGKMSDLINSRMNSGKMGLVFTPNIDGYVLPYSYDTSIEKGLVPDIPIMIGSTMNDIFIPAEVAGDMSKSFLHKGYVNWSLHLEKLGKKPAYIYYFKRRLPGDESGAFHSSELWYVFGTLDRCWRPMEEVDYNISHRMIEYWTNFIKSGNPNGDGKNEWKRYTESDSYVEVIDKAIVSIDNKPIP